MPRSNRSRTRARLIFLLALAGCGDPSDTSAEPTQASGPILTVQAITAADFAAGVPVDGIVVSLHACQTEPLRCEPVAWFVSDGLLQPMDQANDYRAVWLR